MDSTLKPIQENEEATAQKSRYVRSKHQEYIRGFAFIDVSCRNLLFGGVQTGRPRIAERVTAAHPFEGVPKWARPNRRASQPAGAVKLQPELDVLRTSSPP